MTVTEALKILQGVSKEALPFEVALACGFTPLHLQSFLTAHLQRWLPERRITVFTGLYGNLAGTIESLSERPAHAAAIAIEWTDLDPRLGYRSSGQWGPGVLPDVLSVARTTLDRMGASVGRIPAGVRVAVSLPTLPLPPMFHTPGWQSSEEELLLDRMVAEFGTTIVRGASVSLVNATRLAEESAPKDRYDLKSDLLTGLPYRVAHADAMGSALARLISPRLPKKGIITDLDDTLWSGLVGEVGPEGIGWDLSGHGGLNGLYQRLLSSLAKEGVLIGVASKNDPAVVQRAFERVDIVLRQEHVFPVEVHWNAKSGSVERILRAWNIGADSVVFVDDSPMELAEVAAAHPGVECIQFPAKDYEAGYAMLRRIRDLFGKQMLSAEDAIRLASLRQSARFQEAAGESSPEASESFLKQAGAIVNLDFRVASEDARALELVNKTNQFNLNGIRYTDADWARELSRPNAVLITVSYEDKFGPLGKIAVMEGWHEGDTLRIGVWVMSCRAFARRIEHQCLRACFDRYQTSRIEFNLAATNKNGPLREFFHTLLGQEAEGPVVLTRERFEQASPQLYHTVTETRRNQVNG